ncbi:hypothetical protein WN55_05459 [Dufourea novaeangliae]|uniref:Uncharacterized protein n=1 Tax=Dufourea novaeangliae TaxID=178035 RepID=A0A154P0H6_DUFNO|nr:hypothetical protein WN55_05459 [Dufourea novaeangliae]
MEKISIVCVGNNLLIKKLNPSQEGIHAGDTRAGRVSSGHVAWARTPMELMFHQHPGVLARLVRGISAKLGARPAQVHSPHLHVGSLGLRPSSWISLLRIPICWARRANAVSWQLTGKRRRQGKSGVCWPARKGQKMTMERTTKGTNVYGAGGFGSPSTGAEGGSRPGPPASLSIDRESTVVDRQATVFSSTTTGEEASGAGTSSASAPGVWSGVPDAAPGPSGSTGVPQGAVADCSAAAPPERPDPLAQHGERRRMRDTQRRRFGFVVDGFRGVGPLRRCRAWRGDGPQAGTPPDGGRVRGPGGGQEAAPGAHAAGAPASIGGGGGGYVGAPTTGAQVVVRAAGAGGGAVGPGGKEKRRKRRKKPPAPAVVGPPPPPPARPRAEAPGDAPTGPDHPDK